MNQVINTLLNRVSLRRYKNEMIKDVHLNWILQSMKRAPTAGNQMLYSVIVIKDQETKNKLSITCDNQPFIAKAPVVLIIVADQQKWFDYYDINDCKTYCEENQLEYKSPQLGDLFIAIQDAVIAAQNAVIAAESLSIGSCYIGDILENYEIHKELLNLPDFVFPISMLTLGYYPDDYKKNIRSRFDDQFIIFNEKYNKLSHKQINEMFLELNDRYVENNTYNAKNYSQMFYARKTNSEFMREMNRSIGVMLENWKGNKFKK